MTNDELLKKNNEQIYQLEKQIDETFDPRERRTFKRRQKQLQNEYIKQTTKLE
ncbi:MAG: hypothetical protein WCY82_07445 [Desulfotomaculaceae bacterium]